MLAFSPALSVPAQTADSAQPGMLHVEGNLLKSASGQVIRLQGVNVAGMEWSNNGEGRVLQSTKVAIEEWKANAIRLPLAQDRWFGFCDGQRDGGAEYRALVDSVVRCVARKNCYVILDLHWSDAGTWGKRVAQHKMPDMNSVPFWVDVSTHYANHPAVLFDLYNEPHDIPWTDWKNGGTVTEKADDGETLSYQSPGMQRLVDTIRAAGANNVLVAGGIDWAFDLSGIGNGFALSDPKGGGIMYAAHIYPWKGGMDRWDSCVAVVAGKYPILVGEVGCRPDAKQEDPKTWAPKVLAYIEKSNLNWTAWCFHPGASPCMLRDWSYAPTPYWGEFVKSALAKKKRL